jgi:RimJ/RimL family protein N-acetyltransferase
MTNFHENLIIETPDEPVCIHDYAHLTNDDGSLFQLGMMRNERFHSIADFHDANTLFKSKLGWSAIFEHTYFTKPIPTFGIFIKPEFRGRGFFECLAMLTLDMAEERGLEYFVCSDVVMDRLQVLVEGRNIKIIPCWFDLYPDLIYPRDLLTEAEINSHGDIKLLKDSGISIFEDSRYIW